MRIVAIKKMKAGANWESKRIEFMINDEEDMTDDEIKQKWASAADVASKRGTYMHWLIEMFSFTIGEQ